MDSIYKQRKAGLPGIIHNDKKLYIEIPLKTKNYPQIFQGG